MKRRLFFLALLAMTEAVSAKDLYQGGGWPALAADRRAQAIGDNVLILVSESAQASNAVTKGSRKRTKLDGRISGGSLDESGSFGFGGAYDGEGRSGRSDRVVARLSASVALVYPNGDLLVSGVQHLHVNGELTAIRVQGRVRPQDIGADNSVQSTRLADAIIEYNGRGFSTRGAKPGIVTRLFGFLGLL
ncbi:MAG: flagellar basal body L-ring protein FlgH [Proteobacteria bacterium]|nr:flagellar basal body L-ring protein FlgH [Pseudomonadota bacterium]